MLRTGTLFFGEDFDQKFPVEIDFVPMMRKENGGEVFVAEGRPSLPDSRTRLIDCPMDDLILPAELWRDENEHAYKREQARSFEQVCSRLYLGNIAAALPYLNTRRGWGSHFFVSTIST